MPIGGLAASSANSAERQAGNNALTVLMACRSALFLLLFLFLFLSLLLSLIRDSRFATRDFSGLRNSWLKHV